MRTRLSFLAVPLALFGIASMGESLRIQGKAVLAQFLIERAWRRTLQTGVPVRPWHWADTWPVARLHFERSRKTLVVLDGANGGSLAFAPAHVRGTAYPGEPGTSVVIGHRDTHFHVLASMVPGDDIAAQSRDGRWTHYEVESMRVIDTRVHPVWSVSLARDELQLITCYPFGAIAPGGPLRYIVTARRKFR